MTPATRYALRCLAWSVTMAVVGGMSVGFFFERDRRAAQDLPREEVEVIAVEVVPGFACKGYSDRLAVTYRSTNALRGCRRPSLIGAGATLWPPRWVTASPWCVYPWTTARAATTFASSRSLSAAPPTSLPRLAWRRGYSPFSACSSSRCNRWEPWCADASSGGHAEP